MSVPSTSIARGVGTLSEAPVARLRELRGRLSGGDELERWTAACISDYLEHAQHGRTLDASFELNPPPGGTPWWRVESLEARDNALRALAGKFSGEMDVAAQAGSMARMFRRYRDGRWRHDRLHAATDCVKL